MKSNHSKIILVIISCLLSTTPTKPASEFLQTTQSQTISSWETAKKYLNTVKEKLRKQWKSLDLKSETKRLSRELSECKQNLEKLLKKQQEETDKKYLEILEKSKRTHDLAELEESLEKHTARKRKEESSAQKEEKGLLEDLKEKMKSWWQY